MRGYENKTLHEDYLTWSFLVERQRTRDPPIKAELGHYEDERG